MSRPERFAANRCRRTDSHKGPLNRNAQNGVPHDMDVEELGTSITEVIR